MSTTVKEVSNSTVSNELETRIANNLVKKTKLQAARMVSSIQTKNMQLNDFLDKEFKLPTNLQPDKLEQRIADEAERGMHAMSALKVTLTAALAKDAKAEIEATKEKFEDFIEDNEVLERFENRLVDYLEFLNGNLHVSLEKLYKLYFS